MSRRNGFILLGLACAAIALLVLGDFSYFDERGLTLVRTGEQQSLIGPNWVGSMLRDITAMGSNWLLLYFSTVAVLALTIIKRGRHASALGLMVLGGVVLGIGSKYIFQRARPDIVETLAHVYTPSFPSGHATISMVCFVGCALVFSTLTRSAGLKVLLWVVALLSTLMIGLSRIALGVHWPTDVIGGWVIGATWIGLVYYWYRSRLTS